MLTHFTNSSVVLFQSTLIPVEYVWHHNTREKEQNELNDSKPTMNSQNVTTYRLTKSISQRSNNIGDNPFVYAELLCTEHKQRHNNF